MSSAQSTIISMDHNDLVCEFNEEGWLNATKAAAHFGKRPVDWLVLASTQKYIEVLKRKHENISSYCTTTRG